MDDRPYWRRVFVSPRDTFYSGGSLRTSETRYFTSTGNGCAQLQCLTLAEAARSEEIPCRTAAWTVEERGGGEPGLGRVKRPTAWWSGGDRAGGEARPGGGQLRLPADPRNLRDQPPAWRWRLFGSSAVVGLEVRCQGTDYLVRGHPGRPAYGDRARLRFLRPVSPMCCWIMGPDRGAKSGADQLLYHYDAGSARYRVDGEICLAAAGFCISAGVGGPGTGPVCVFWPGKRLLRRFMAVSAAALAAAACIRILGAEEPGFRRTSSPPDGRISASGASGGGRSLRAALCRGKRPRFVDDSAAGMDDCRDSVRNRRGTYGHFYRGWDCKENVIDTQGQNE